MKYEGNADWRIGGQMTLFLIVPALKFSLSSELPVTDYLNFTDLIFIWATLIVSTSLIIGILGNYYIHKKDSRLLEFSELLAQKLLPLATPLTFIVILLYVFL